MSYIAPDSDVYILRGVSLDRNYQHTLYQENIENQFYKITNNHIKKEFHKYSYQRAGKGKIRVEALADDLYDCNYMAFRNTAYGNKWFYAFIDSVEYINDNCTEVSYTIDVMQTWYFDYDLGQCFVEREHTLTDNFGENVIDENLGKPELTIENKKTFNFGKNFVVAFDYVPNKYIFDKFVLVAQAPLYEIRVESILVLSQAFSETCPVKLYNGIPNGYATTFIEMDDFTLEGYTDEKIPLVKLSALINWANSVGNEIANIRLIPKSVYYQIVIFGQEKFSLQLPITRSDAFKYKNGNKTPYIPKNKKLYQFPYRQILVTNNSGGSATYKWENFISLTNNTVRFRINGVLQPNCEIFLYPTNYKNIDDDYESGFPFTNFPSTTWNEDSFSKWYNQNKNSIASSYLSAAISLSLGAASAISGNAFIGASMIGSGISNIIKSVATTEDAKNVPDQLNGQQSINNIQLIEDRNGYTIYDMGIDAENAKVIDDYFSMFGYAIKQVKVPNIKSANSSSLRPTWNYVKTQECVIHASAGRGLPAEDEEKIAKIYNNGITFWNDLSKVGNYNENNAPRA